MDMSNKKPLTVNLCVSIRAKQFRCMIKHIVHVLCLVLQKQQNTHDRKTKSKIKKQKKNFDT